MSTNMKFPPSAKIKRAIAAAERAGISISSIDIHPRKITTYVRDLAEKKSGELIDSK